MSLSYSRHAALIQSYMGVFFVTLDFTWIAGRILPPITRYITRYITR